MVSNTIYIQMIMQKFKRMWKGTTPTLLLLINNDSLHYNRYLYL